MSARSPLGIQNLVSQAAYRKMVILFLPGDKMSPRKHFQIWDEREGNTELIQAAIFARCRCNSQESYVPKQIN